ncbi:hypothetical protein CCACVL1_30792 [Corchorus capsularis]|uniref:Uncharacterized protein n=1 Tax=Corchorus capsularis TaxID=210143 RepID=A0A1R3FVG1_COCAP|nr:hypothetical protein CCACVL1_30792 [Corchorus capsularis]
MAKEALLTWPNGTLMMPIEKHRVGKVFVAELAWLLALSSSLLLADVAKWDPHDANYKVPRRRDG